MVDLLGRVEGVRGLDAWRGRRADEVGQNCARVRSAEVTFGRLAKGGEGVGVCSICSAERVVIGCTGGDCRAKRRSRGPGRMANCLAGLDERVSLIGPADRVAMGLLLGVEVRLAVSMAVMGSNLRREIISTNISNRLLVELDGFGASVASTSGFHIRG